MTRLEFSTVMAYIAAAVDKPFPKDRAEVFWDLLGDLPIDTFRIAAKRVVLSHPWSTFPSVAELREAATVTTMGNVTELAPAEAWRLASEAIARIDPEIRGRPYRMRGKDGTMQEFSSQAEAVLDQLPPAVVRTIRAYGLHPMCYGQEPMGVVRGQFLKMYDQIAAEEKKRATIPEALAKEIEGRAKTLPPSAVRAIEQIGAVPQ